MSDPEAKRILLVEDIDILRANYQTILEAHHFSVVGCGTKADAQDAFARESFDVVILDVTLGADYEAGFALCQTFRAKQETIPIVFLTERDEDPDRISGLRLGADDYLTKTVSAAYLVARIHALIRRVEALTEAAATKGPITEGAMSADRDRPIIEGSNLEIDSRLSMASWKGQPIDLSLTQFWILSDLAGRAGSVRSIEELMVAANITVQPNTIVAHIKTIREKIQRIDPAFACIKAERARGYRWLEEVGSSAEPAAD